MRGYDGEDMSFTDIVTSTKGQLRASSLGRECTAAESSWRGKLRKSMRNTVLLSGGEEDVYWEEEAKDHHRSRLKSVSSSK